MSHRSHLRVIAGVLGAAVQLAVLLVLELVLTMLVYIYLNLFHLTTFGALVRGARSVLDVMAGQLDYWLPGSADAAYATLIGELGPKSILLLLIGLVVAAVMRGLARAARGLAAGARRSPAIDAS
jgi:hypothetical protein